MTLPLQSGPEEQQACEALARLTGFDYAVFFQTGTAAIEAAVSVLAGRRRARVAVPALGCWTVSYAVTKLGRTPTFCDVDRYWSARLEAPARDADLAILVDPWGGCADWRRASAAGPPLVADLTHAPGARLDGQLASKWCVAGVVSFGSGKPLSVGGGGAALFRDLAAAREAKRLFRFGFRDGGWSSRLERYVFSPALFPEILKRLRGLPSGNEAAERSAQMRAAIGSLGLSSNELRPGGSWGHETCFPVCLPKNFPLTASEVEGVSVSSGLRLARHPVSPPYLQKAWGRRPRGSCPRAEAIAARTLFYYPSDRQAGDLRKFFSRLLEAPERFRTPFALPRPSGALPGDLGRLAARARLVRNLDGNFGLLEEDFNLMWPVDEREAALVQAGRRLSRAS